MGNAFALPTNKTSFKKRLPVRLSAVLFVVFLFLVNGAAFWFARTSSAEMAELNKTIRELESNIGYSGLIHHFKNAVLRPEEPEHIDRARKAAQTALSLAAELSQWAHDQRIDDVEGMLDPVREMIRQYEARLDLIDQGIMRDLSIQDIDQMVRYDDLPAATGLDKFSAAIDRQVLATRAVVDGLSIALSLGSIALFTGLLTADARRGKKWLMEREALLENNRALNQYAVTIAHELQNPAAQVAMISDLLSDSRDFADPDSRKLIGLLDQTSTSMISLINSVLEFSRKLKQPVEKSRFVMWDLVKEVVAAVEAQHGTQHEIFIGRLPDTPADRQLMERVWANLIENAIKYSRPGQRANISITGRTGIGENTYVIKDKGIGIPASKGEEIFEPMQRLVEGTEFGDGYGVGLNLVKSIIHRHGGSIKLDTSYDEGASFVIVLPMKN